MGPAFRELLKIIQSLVDARIVKLSSAPIRKTSFRKPTFEGGLLLVAIHHPSH